ncbi:MAG: helix-turn-helix domain-containing protein [Nocardioides sp.]|nr:helix-turn-helix domain-containing protein [Nocardioides sp.]
MARIPFDEAASAIVEHLRSQIPAYDRLSAASRQEIVRAIEINLRRVHAWLSTGAVLQDSDFDVLREEARARATDGVRLEDLERACGLAGQFTLQLIRRYARASELEAVLEAAGIVMQYVGQVSAIFADVYLAERERLVSEDERRMRDLMEILTAKAVLDADDRELADRAGIPIEARYTPFVAVLPGRPPSRHAQMAARLRRRGGGLAVTESERVIGLAWRPLSVADLGEGPDALLAIGGPTPRDELAGAHDDLDLLVDDACQRGIRGRVEIQDNLLELLVLRSPRTTALLRDGVLAPLTAPEHEHLLQTLRTLLTHRLDRPATCAALQIHRNTLAYRLRRISQLAEVDLQDPRDMARIYLAMATGE